MQPNSVDRILEYAIRNEERAAAFYRYFAEEAPRESTKDVFLRFAGDQGQRAGVRERGRARRSGAG
jgi:rubrerythrin